MSSTTCEQCGRTGTRGFRSVPEEDLIFDDAGQVAIYPAHSMAECAGKTACRRRCRKLSGGAAGHAERMRMYES